ncbi:MAG: DUF5011 domain-containing protein [Bacillota bacterium]|nr:MAG: DUF5011 domain-containing protein [Bacillota bacterium]
MKRENLVLIINAAIMIVVGLLLVVAATQVVPNAPEDLLFNQVVTLKNKESIQPIPDENIYMIVNSKEEAYNNSNQLVGTVYTVIMKNTYGITGPDDTNGYLELLVGIDQNDLVTVEIVELVQSNWTISGIQRYIKTVLKNVPASEVAAIAPYDATNTDLMSGMTATNTTNWIKEMVLLAIDFHENGIPQDPMLIGVEVVVAVEKDGTFEPLEGITAYDYQDGDLTEDIEVIGFDTVNLTAPGTYNYTVQVTDSDNHTTSIPVTLTVTGAEIQVFDDAFGNGYVSIKDNSFAATATVLEKYDVTLNDVAVGTIYKLTGTTIYNDYDVLSGDISLYVALDLDNIILQIDLPSAEYNHSKGGYYTASLDFAVEYEGVDLAIVRTHGADILAGSTARSRNLMIDLLEDLKEVVLG